MNGRHFHREKYSYTEVNQDNNDVVILVKIGENLSTVIHSDECMRPKLSLF